MRSKSLGGALSTAVVALTLAATSARGEGLRASLTFGLGAGHGLLGPQAEVGYDHVSAFGAAVPASFLDVSLGARWSLQPSGAGFGLALQASSRSRDISDRVLERGDTAPRHRIVFWCATKTSS